jgi:hypothetical protein
MRVEVYWNFNKKCYSVRCGGKVLFHTDRLFLRDVKFAVQEGGRQRVLREKRKNVHAFVRGFIEEDRKIVGKSISYNPYKYSSFIFRKDQKSIFSAKFARLLVKDKKEYIIAS